MLQDIIKERLRAKAPPFVLWVAAMLTLWGGNIKDWYITPDSYVSSEVIIALSAVAIWGVVFTAYGYYLRVSPKALRDDVYVDVKAARALVNAYLPGRLRHYDDWVRAVGELYEYNDKIPRNLGGKSFSLMMRAYDRCAKNEHSTLSTVTHSVSESRKIQDINYLLERITTFIRDTNWVMKK